MNMMEIVIDGLVCRRDADGQYSVVSCDASVVDAVIHLTVYGATVIGIGDRAFSDCAALESITFVDAPDAIDAAVYGFTVGEEAFADCSSLKEISLPDSTTAIGRSAFRGCKAIERVEIGRAYVSPYAFYMCEALVSVSPLSNVSEGAFSHCKSLSCLPLFDGVTEIGEDAFEHCYSLTDITVPKSVKRIGSLAFRSCYGLMSVTFEDANGWYCHNGYTNREYPLDLTDPTENAVALSKMDFDDGITAWYKK